MKRILKNRNQIYALCALWIMFFHIAAKVGIPGNLPGISSLIRTGNIAVDIFIFLSGYCLSLSFSRNSNLKSFFEKRLVRVGIPYLIFSIPFYLWKSIVEFPINSGFNWKLFMLDISGISFWLQGNQNTWFVATIIVFYILFPFIYKYVNKSKKNGVVILMITYILNIAGLLLIPIYNKSNIAWTRLPIFIIGILSACYGVDIKTKKQKRAIIIGSVYTFILLCIIPVREIYINYIGKNYTLLWLFYMTMVFPLMYIFGYLVDKMCEGVKRLLNVIGGVSLEIYMVHVMIIHILTFYSCMNKMGWISYIVIPLVSIFISLIVSCAIKFINKIFNGGEN